VVKTGTQRTQRTQRTQGTNATGSSWIKPNQTSGGEGEGVSGECRITLCCRVKPSQSQSNQRGGRLGLGKEARGGVVFTVRVGQINLKPGQDQGLAGARPSRILPSQSNPVQPSPTSQTGLSRSRARRHNAHEANNHNDLYMKCWPWRLFLCSNRLWVVSKI